MQGASHLSVSISAVARTGQAGQARTGEDRRDKAKTCASVAPALGSTGCCATATDDPCFGGRALAAALNGPARVQRHE